MKPASKSIDFLLRIWIDFNFFWNIYNFQTFNGGFSYFLIFREFLWRVLSESIKLSGAVCYWIICEFFCRKFMACTPWFLEHESIIYLGGKFGTHKRKCYFGNFVWFDFDENWYLPHCWNLIQSTNVLNFFPPYIHKVFVSYKNLLKIVKGIRPKKSNLICINARIN